MDRDGDSRDGEDVCGKKKKSKQEKKNSVGRRTQ